MSLKVFNNLTQTKVNFETNKFIKWYTCGPTVYDYSHIGHARNYVSFDIIRRILEDHFGYHITFVMNITDVDDKIIKRSQEEGISVKELTSKWEQSFLEDMEHLNVKPPTVLTRVSQHIDEIISFIQKLIEKEMAYISNGSVYFDVIKFKETHRYSKLANRDNNVDEDVEEKKTSMDFALWKAKFDEPSWDSPWSRGRPGWHIECSAMANYILGDTIEIHTGGEDLKFPHHDNELAQSEAYYDKEWVKYFLHSGHLHIQGAKMSKSLKNFITIKDALQKYSSRQLRMLFLLHNYDAILEYNENTMNYAISIDDSFVAFFDTLKMACKELKENKWKKKDFEFHHKFLELKIQTNEYLEDNFNTSGLVQTLIKFMSHTHKYINDGQYFLIKEVYQYYMKLMKIFGFEYEIIYQQNNSDKLIDILVKYRSDIRIAVKSKNLNEIYKLSDEIRDVHLHDLGIKLVDKGNTSSWTY